MLRSYVVVSLEEEVETIMERALKASPSALRAITDEGPIDPSSIQDALSVMSGMLVGQRKAILRIAREIDQAR